MMSAMRRPVRVHALAFAALSWIGACGARTGLPIIIEEDATTHVHDASHEHMDATVERVEDVTTERSRDGHPLDVMPDCTTPTYCQPGDPGYIYKCGVRVYECGLLDQCVEPCGEAGAGEDCAAECLNPCVNSLGENTSNGCEFYALEVDTTHEAHGVCYAVFVVNQWQSGQAARLQVEYQGHTYSNSELENFTRIPTGTGTGITYAPFDATAGLAQNQIAILFLSRDPKAASGDYDGATPGDPAELANCPPGVTPAVSGDAALHGTGTGSAFRIKTNVPIVAYQMLPYGGGRSRVTGATLLLPTNVWADNYIAVNAYEQPTSPMILGPDPNAEPTLAILAQQDNTHVTIKPVADIVAGGGLAGVSAGSSVTYVVDRGQYLQFSQPQELTGSPIQSDHPIAVIGGSSLMDVPVTAEQRADHGEQMLPPVRALGSEYVAVRYRSRKPGADESIPWRVVGVVDGTTLTYDPSAPAGAPTSLNQGQVVEFDDPGPWVISSQDSSHPFYLAQYMTGGSTVDPTGSETTSIYYGAGDPEFVNVITPSQYLPGYTFFTDPTYPETNLVIVAVKDGPTNEFPSVNLDCAGMLKDWQPVGTSGKYQFTRVDLSTGDFKGVGKCNNGVHTIAATLSGAPPGEAPFIGVTVWGWGSGATGGTTMTDPSYTRWVSYAYPAGANITKLNSVVVPAK